MTLTRHALPAAVAVLAALALAPPPAAPAADRDGGGAVVVWEGPATDGLGSVWIDAVGEALRAAAADAGVVVCHDDGARSTDRDFLEICAEPPVNAPLLWWRGDVETRTHRGDEVVVLSLVLELQPEQAAPELGRRLILLSEQFHLPGELVGSERELMLAGRMHEPIRRSGQVRQWFEGLATIDFLERVPPAGTRIAGAAPPADPDSDGAGANPQSPDPAGHDAAAGAWTEAEHRVLDLVLDGAWEEAVAEADAALEDDALPPEAAIRLRDLRARAATRRDAPAGKEPAAEPAQAGEPAEVATGDGGDVPPEPFDVTYRVRAASPGRGFVRGADGRLRISDHGVAFVPDDPAAAERWHLGWTELQQASRAKGLWDVRWPLAIEGAGGTHYVAEIRADGGFADGEGILSSIAEGRRRARGDGGGAGP